MSLTLHYWPIKARNYVAVVIAQAGGLQLHQNHNVDLAAMKPTLPFGQLPYLVDGDVKLAQSGAIIRYLARKAHLQGDSEADFAKSEMLIEEMQDIFTVVAKAQYSPDKVDAYKTLFAEDGAIHKHLDFLEKLLTGDNFNSKALAGDYAIAAILDILVHLEAHVLDNFAKLHAFYQRHINGPAFAGVKDLPMYFKRD